MTIYLPIDVESSIQAVVQSGRFASFDEAMVEAARLLLKALNPGSTTVGPEHSQHSSLGFIGALRDDAALLDQAVEHAMRVREERPWRLNSVE